MNSASDLAGGTTGISTHNKVGGIGPYAALLAEDSSFCDLSSTDEVCINVGCPFGGRSRRLASGETTVSPNYDMKNGGALIDRFWGEVVNKIPCQDMTDAQNGDNCGCRKGKGSIGDEAGSATAVLF